MPTSCLIGQRFSVLHFAFTKFKVREKKCLHFHSVEISANVEGSIYSKILFSLFLSELFTLQVCSQCDDLQSRPTASKWCWSSKTRKKKAYPKLLHSSLRRLWVVPQFDHGHGHRLVKDDIHTVHLQTNISVLKSLCELAGPVNPAAVRRSRTCPGSTGANHMCLPSLVLLTPSISLSGVLTSPLTLSRTLTLSGKAAMSGAHS